MGFQDVVNFVVEKLKELWFAIENLWGEFLGWFDKVFPPDTRGEQLHHWIQVALPFILAAVLLMILVCCCYKCCCRRGGRGTRIRMMKAPGRNCTMPRNAFESDPKGYFLRLRAHPGDDLC